MSILNPIHRRRLRRDLEDLVGTPPEDEPDDVEEEDEAPSAKLSLKSFDMHKIGQGVSVQWLARGFRMTRAAVEKKLIHIRPVGYGQHGNPLYDLPEAASYLVKPQLDLKKYLETVKPDALPERLREAVWNSKLKRQRWEEKAQHLWRTETVMSRFAEVLANVRQQLQLIPDRVERMTGLDIAQYKIIRNIIDEVQEEIYQEILALSKGRMTGNQMLDEGIPDPTDDDDVGRASEIEDLA